MKNMKFWRTALVATLVLTVMLSVTGGTIAWFTDSVTTGENTIKAGNLDIELEYKTELDDEWAPVTETTKLFKENALYEPGYTEVVFLRLKNAGTLSLKYQMGVDVTNTVIGTSVLGNDIKLSKYMQIGAYAMDATLGALVLPAMFNSRENAVHHINTEDGTGFIELDDEKTVMITDDDPQYVIMKDPKYDDAQIIALVLHMPTTVGNEANYRGDKIPQMNIALNFEATQYTHEEDSFGPDYDKNATWPGEASTAAELKSALAAGGEVKLLADIDLGTETGLVIDKDTVLDLNDHIVKGSAERDSLFTVNGDADLIITNGTLDVVSGVEGNTSWGAGNAVYFDSTGTLTMEDVEIVASKRGGWRAVEVYGGTAELTDVKIEATRGSGVNAGSGANVVLNNCEITVTEGYSAPYNSVAFSVMSGASLTVNGGNYTSNNVQGQASLSTHGNWLGIVMNSGGTLTINGGTFTNNPAPDFNAQYERALFYAQGNTDVSSVINLNGGNFKPQSTNVWDAADGGVVNGRVSENPNAEGYYTVVGE